MTGAVAVPVCQAASYRFRNAEHAVKPFAPAAFGGTHPRAMISTCDALEQRVSALGVAAATLAVSSGRAASTTVHSQLSPEEQRTTGVSDGYARLPVGIEHIADFIADPAQALNAV